MMPRTLTRTISGSLETVLSVIEVVVEDQDRFETFEEIKVLVKRGVDLEPEDINYLIDLVTYLREEKDSLGKTVEELKVQLETLASQPEEQADETSGSDTGEDQVEN